jgi:hypothetical protein
MKGMQSASGSHLGASQSSILFRQHDRDDPLGDGGIGGIGRVHWHAVIEIVDLEKDPVAVGLERSKVVFLMRVVRMAKVVEDSNRFDDAFDSNGAEGRLSLERVRLLR